jgi:cytosine/adenosine deaminase-related metal-dependent hydrolase
MAVVYCPRTHAYFGHSRYPLETMLSRGCQVALGTDSRASNPDLSLLAELRFAATKFPALSPEVLVRMATISGAEALRLGDRVGSLSVGKQADLIALPCGRSSGDPYDDLLHGSAGPVNIFLAGHEVMAPA